MRFKKYSCDKKYIEETDRIEKDLLTARTQAERLLIFQIASFQKTFMNDVKEEKNNNSKEFSESKRNSLNKEDKMEINEIQREISFHYGYLLKYIKSTHNLKMHFLEQLNPNSTVIFYQLWEEIDDLYNSIFNDIFATEEQAFLQLQRIRQNFKIIL